MKIAVTAMGPTLDASVDPRFGRCPYFVFVETEDMSFEARENTNVMRGGGAGIQSAQWMSDQGVECVLTGNCGPNAYRTLEAAGIKVVIGCSGTVREAVERHRPGSGTPTSQPNVPSHFGMGMAPGASDAERNPRETGGGGKKGGNGTGRGPT